MAVCMSASPPAMLVGSPLAGFLTKHTDGLLGLADWQWLFIIEGIPPVVLGLLAFFLLTDRPRDATWLIAEERVHVDAELSRGTARLSGREDSLWAILRLRTTWVLILSLFCIFTGNATLSFYGPGLVTDEGFTDLADLGWVMSASSRSAGPACPSTAGGPIAGAKHVGARGGPRWSGHWA
ncbi:MFS transporter [Streptomyces sp. NPDC059262]|uniref:MFS transporter n=1 Tax=Streptomyces sp. NPDC059262 TaxID=3346797 RepID=UPI0036A20979